MKITPKLIRSSLWGICFLGIVFLLNVFGWSLVFFGPRTSKLIEPIVYVLSLPGLVFYGPAFLIPPESILNSSTGLIFITLVLTLSWGFILEQIRLKTRDHFGKRET